MKTFVLFFLLAPGEAWADPSWAGKGDRADDHGHVFVCAGEGKNENDALASALGICSDKVCKVCGVEVISTLNTKETLTGIDVQHEVVERCRRVRKREPKIDYKSVDCGPDGCKAWVQVTYSKEDEQAECPRYSDEKFADPERCEKEIDAFANIPGYSAESFAKRRALLDAALGDCKEIDVRPTPAIMALDAKLGAGQEAFEPSVSQAIEWLRAPKGLRKQISESKTLVERIQLVRDYVADRFFVFSIYDAVRAPDMDTPAGVQRLLHALGAYAPGVRYGAADDVHIAFLFKLDKVKSDTTVIGDYLRQAYPPAKLLRSGNFLGQDGCLARFFASDGKVSEAEWKYIVAAHQLTPCVGCLRNLVAAKDHGTDEIRLQRLVFAYETLSDREKPGSLNHLFQHFMPIGDSAFLLRNEKKLPAAMQTWFDGRMLEAMWREAERNGDEESKKRVAKRFAEALAQKPVTENERDYCDHLDDRLGQLEKAGAPGLTAADPMLCWCLNGAMKTMSDRYHAKQVIVARSLAHKLGCRCPYNPATTHANVVFDWKRGETPRHYTPFAEKKVRFSLTIDPTWLACAMKDESSRLGVHFYQGKSEGEARSAENGFYDIFVHTDHAKAEEMVDGVGFCQDGARFIAWELRGEGELAALNSDRQVQPIHCE